MNFFGGLFWDKNVIQTSARVHLSKIIQCWYKIQFGWNNNFKQSPKHTTQQPCVFIIIKFLKLLRMERSITMSSLTTQRSRMINKITFFHNNFKFLISFSGFLIEPKNIWSYMYFVVHLPKRNRFKHFSNPFWWK